MTVNYVLTQENVLLKTCELKVMLYFFAEWVYLE